MNLENEINLPVLSIKSTVEMLAKAYSTIISNGEKIKAFPSVMLWGPPGVGKSQAVREIAEKLEKELGKKVNITDVRLLLFNPIDLRGIPVANDRKTLAVWLKPKIFQMDESDDIINILFLDEISAAPQSVQAAAYQITLDRVVGEHKLPENCIVIAAGNRVTDKSVAFKMPKALANRLLHIEIKGDFTSWKNWALASGINSKVIGFLSFQNNYLFGFNPLKDELAFATPRSWEMVSNILNKVSDNIDEIYPLVSGLIGASMAYEFKRWCKVYEKLPDINRIFDGTETKAPIGPDEMFAVISSIASNSLQHRFEASAIENSIKYVRENMPPDFQILLAEEYKSLYEDYPAFLEDLYEYQRLKSQIGVKLNGHIEK